MQERKLSKYSIPSQKNILGENRDGEKISKHNKYYI